MHSLECNLIEKHECNIMHIMPTIVGGWLSD